MNKHKPTVRARIRLIDPPPGAAFAVQRGADDIVPPTAHTETEIICEFVLQVADRDAVPVRFTGEFAHGPAAARFVYICSGVRAGQTDSPIDRRAKVPLAGISAELVDAALAEDRVLEASIAGRAKDGGPAAASVPLLSGWKLV